MTALQFMRSPIRLAAIFAALYAASCAVVSVSLPRLMGWHIYNCAGSSSALCRASAGTLQYWWLALIPLLVLATALIHLAFTKRQ